MTLLATGLGLGRADAPARSAEAWLREALALCRAHELDGQIDYSQAWLALCRMCAAHGTRPRAWRCEVAGTRRRAGDEPADGAAGAGAAARCAAATPAATKRWTRRWRWPARARRCSASAPLRAARAEAAFTRGDRAAVRAEVAGRAAAGAGQGTPLVHRRTGLLGLARRRQRRDARPAAPSPTRWRSAGRWREAAAAWQRWTAPTSGPARWPRATPRRSSRRWRLSSAWARARRPRRCAARCARPACAAWRAARAPPRARTPAGSRGRDDRCWR